MKRAPVAMNTGVGVAGSLQVSEIHCNVILFFNLHVLTTSAKVDCSEDPDTRELVCAQVDTGILAIRFRCLYNFYTSGF